MAAYSNIGLLFNKHYFKDISYQGDYKKENENISKLKSKNEQLINSALNNTQTILGNQKITLLTTYPGLILGTGYPHESGVEGEFKLGLFFDYTTGLPFLPSSSVKGTLRSAFKKGEVKGEYIHYLLEEELNINGIDIAKLETAIFEDNEDKKSIYDRDIFFDAYPIGTKQKRQFLASDYITPHLEALKNPVPIHFLKVLPNINFQFNFSLKESGGLTAEQKIKLFKHILLDLGIGAKTNVGYGQLIVDPEIEKQEKIAEENKIAEEIAKAIEEKRIEDQKRREEKIKLDAENLAKREQANRNKANQSLEISLKEITDFNKGKKIIEKYSKNNNLDTQVEFIKQFVINAYTTEITDNKKKRNWIKKGKQNWYKISEWLEEDSVNNLFEKLSKK